VPGGCLSLVLIAVAFIGGIFFVVISAMKESGAYEIALARAKENPAVIQALGKPIRAAWFPSGSAHSVGTGGDANLAIPIRGPKATATVYVAAIEVAGIWHFDTLAVQVESTHRRIDLDTRALNDALMRRSFGR